MSHRPAGQTPGIEGAVEEHLFDIGLQIARPAKQLNRHMKDLL